MANATNSLFDSVESFNRYYGTSITSDVGIMHINAQSCANLETFDEIKKFISLCPFTVHTLIISETWFKDNQCDIYEIEDYYSLHSCRKSSRGGGLSVYVSVHCRLNHSSLASNAFNYIHINIDIGSCKGIDIVGFYRPPNNNNLNDFMETCSTILEKCGNNSFFLGDTNIDTNSMRNTSTSKTLLNTFESHGFQLCNIEVTRAASNTTIDHVFSNTTHQYQHHTDTIPTPLHVISATIISC